LAGAPAGGGVYFAAARSMRCVAGSSAIVRAPIAVSSTVRAEAGRLAPPVASKSAGARTVE